MRVDVIDTQDYQSAQQMRDAARERRLKFFSPVPSPMANTPPQSSTLQPVQGSSPVEETVRFIVGAVAAHLNLTPDEVFNDAANAKAQIARKIAAAIVVRRSGILPAQVAEILGIVPAAVLDGLCDVDMALRDYVIPRTAPLDQFLKLVFDNLQVSMTTPRLTIEEIKRAVGLHFRVSVADICSARRTACVVYPRQLAMALSRHLTLKSLPEIGRRFGGRDHTTAMHAINKFAPAVAVAAETLTLISPINAWIIAVDHAFEQGRASRG